MTGRREFDTLNEVYDAVVHKVSQISSVDAKIDRNSSDFTRKFNTIKINIFMKTMDNNNGDAFDKVNKMIYNIIHETREKNMSLKANTSNNGNNLVKNEFNKIEDDSKAKIRVELKKINAVRDRIRECKSDIEKLRVENMELQKKAVTHNMTDNIDDDKDRSNDLSPKNKESHPEVTENNCNAENDTSCDTQELESQLRNRISELEGEIHENSRSMLSKTTKISRNIGKLQQSVDELGQRLTNLERNLKYVNFQTPRIIQPSHTHYSVLNKPILAKIKAPYQSIDAKAPRKILKVPKNVRLSHEINKISDMNQSSKE